jgi:hypothetical protein
MATRKVGVAGSSPAPGSRVVRGEQRPPGPARVGSARPSTAGGARLRGPSPHLLSPAKRKSVLPRHRLRSSSEPQVSDRLRARLLVARSASAFAGGNADGPHLHLGIHTRPDSLSASVPFEIDGFVIEGNAGPPLAPGAVALSGKPHRVLRLIATATKLTPGPAPQASMPISRRCHPCRGGRAATQVMSRQRLGGVEVPIEVVSLLPTRAMRLLQRL